MFWVLLLSLCLVAAVAIAWPALRRARDTTDTGEVEALRARLHELERERVQGLLDEDAYVRIRAEVGRALITAAEREERPGRIARGARGAVLASAVVTPLAAVLLYFGLGAPGYADQPLAARIEREDVAVLVAQAERHLQQHPDDVRGWATLLPIYRRTNRIADAEKAYDAILASADLDDTRRSALLTDRAEMRLSGTGGAVAPVAADLNEAAVLDPRNVRAAFYLALGIEQGGDRKAARTAWQAVLADHADQPGPWQGVVEQRLAALEGTERGPTAAQVEAAGELSTADRTAMIDGMVASLSERLAREPDDRAGWLRLVRSYVVLEREADAETAWRAASTHFPGDAELAALGRERGWSS